MLCCVCFVAYALLCMLCCGVTSTGASGAVLATGRHIKYMPMPFAMVWDFIFQDALRSTTGWVVDVVAKALITKRKTDPLATLSDEVQ